MSVRQENRNKRRLFTETQRKYDKARQIESAFMVRGSRPKCVLPEPNASRPQVRAWMRSNASEYECATSLAEAANTVFALPGDGLDDETHWVWDEAFSAIEFASA